MISFKKYARFGIWHWDSFLESQLNCFLGKHVHKQGMFGSFPEYAQPFHL